MTTDYETMTESANNDGTLSVHDSWYQGRGAFGGLVAGMFAHRFESLVVDDATRTLRSLSLQCRMPLTVEPAKLSAEVSRSGRYVTYLDGTIRRDEHEIARASCVAASSTGQTMTYGHELMPRVPRPEDVESWPQVPLMPKFTAHFDYRQCLGHPPFAGTSDMPVIGGWVGFREPQPLNTRSLVALADSWPLAPMTTLTAPVPMASVEINYQFFAAPDPTPDFVLVENRSTAASDGFANQMTRVWARDGSLLCTASQLTITLA